MAFLQRGEQVVEGPDGDLRLAAELLEPGIVGGGGVDAECLVGPEGRVNLRPDAELGDLRVVGERIGRVVGRADDGDLVGREDVVHPHAGQLGIGLLPDGVRRLRADDLVDAEVALQLEVRPVVERVAEGVGHGGAPGVELLARRGIPGADALRHAVGAHGAPLVVVSTQPDLGQVGELVVVRDQCLREVAVVVVDRLGLGEVVIQVARGVGLEQEVVVDEEAAHGRRG